MNLNELLKIETTSSYKPDREAHDPMPGPELDPIYESAPGLSATKLSSPYVNKSCCNSERPTSAIIRLTDRNPWNMIGRILYLILKILYMSFWFYWGGFIVPYASYIHPYRAGVYK